MTAPKLAPKAVVRVGYVPGRNSLPEVRRVAAEQLQAKLATRGHDLDLDDVLAGMNPVTVEPNPFDPTVRVYIATYRPTNEGK